MVFAVGSASHRAKTLQITAIPPFFHVFRYFLNCVGPLYMAIKFFAFFFRQSVLSDVFGLNGRHHWQLRAAAQRCGAGGCRREAT